MPPWWPYRIRMPCTPADFGAIAPAVPDLDLTTCPFQIIARRSKLGALELAAMSLKATGTYLSRTLSYAGAEFALAHVEVDPVFK